MAYGLPDQLDPRQSIPPTVPWRNKPNTKRFRTVEVPAKQRKKVKRNGSKKAG